VTNQATIAKRKKMQNKIKAKNEMTIKLSKESSIINYNQSKIKIERQIK